MTWDIWLACIMAVCGSGTVCWIAGYAIGHRNGYFYAKRRPVKDRAPDSDYSAESEGDWGILE